jgi:hypothetical protein
MSAFLARTLSDRAMRRPGGAIFACGRRKHAAHAEIAFPLLIAAMLAASLASAEVTLSPREQARLGVVTRTLATTRHSTQTDAFAKVLDPEPLVQLDSDLAAAEAAASASAAEAARSRALNMQGAALSAKDTEAAIAQARQDALKVDMLRRRLGLEWGPGIARLGAAAGAPRGDRGARAS